MARKEHSLRSSAEAPAETRIDWDTVTVALRKPEAAVHMRIDRDVLDFFRRTGKGYQTGMKAVLKSYVEEMRRSG